MNLETIKRKLRDKSETTECEPGMRRAAAIMLITGAPERLEVVFIKRTDDVPHHKGQMAFPGGLLAEVCESSLDAALRETEEEIGVPREDIEVLGFIGDFSTEVSRSVVSFYSGWLGADVEFVPDGREVAEIILVPLPYLVECHAKFSGGEIPPVEELEYVFETGGKPYRIWGLTARAVWSFLEMIAV